MPRPGASFIAATAIAATIATGIGVAPALADDTGGDPSQSDTQQQVKVTSLVSVQGVGVSIRATPGAWLTVTTGGGVRKILVPDTGLINDIGARSFSLRAGDHVTVADSSGSVLAETDTVLTAPDHDLAVTGFAAGKGLTGTVDGFDLVSVVKGDGTYRLDGDATVSNGTWTIPVSTLLDALPEGGGSEVTLKGVDSKNFYDKYTTDQTWRLPAPGSTDATVTVSSAAGASINTREPVAVTTSDPAVVAVVVEWDHAGTHHRRVLTTYGNQARFHGGDIPQDGDQVTAVGYTNGWKATEPATTTVRPIADVGGVSATISADGLSGHVNAGVKRNITVTRYSDDGTLATSKAADGTTTQLSATESTDDAGNWDFRTWDLVPDEMFTDGALLLVGVTDTGTNTSRHYLVRVGSGQTDSDVFHPSLSQFEQVPEGAGFSVTGDKAQAEWQYRGDGRLSISVAQGPWLNGGPTPHRESDGPTRWEHQVDDGEWVTDGYGDSAWITLDYPAVKPGQTVRVRLTDPLGRQTTRELTVPGGVLNVVHDSDLSIDPVNPGDTTVTVRGPVGYVYDWRHLDADGNLIDSFWGTIPDEGADSIDIGYGDAEAAVSGDIWQVTVNTATWGVRSYKATVDPVARVVGGPGDDGSTDSGNAGDTGGTGDDGGSGTGTDGIDTGGTGSDGGNGGTTPDTTNADPATTDPTGVTVDPATGLPASTLAQTGATTATWWAIGAGIAATMFGAGIALVARRRHQ